MTTPLLSTRVTPMPPRRALWAKLSLFPDRLVLRSLTLRGFDTETFRLDDLTNAEWWSKEGNSGETTLSFDLVGGESVPLHIARGAGLWHAAILNQRPNLRTQAEHPGEERARSYSVAA